MYDKKPINQKKRVCQNEMKTKFLLIHNINNNYYLLI